MYCETYTVRIMRNGARAEYNLQTSDRDEAARRAMELYSDAVTLPRSERLPNKLKPYVLDKHKHLLRIADFSAQHPGVYFLCNGAECVYVGQSKCVAKRIGQHLGGKHFKAAYYIQVPEEDLNKVELQYIAYLRPIYNLSWCKTHRQMVRETEERMAA